MDNEPLQWAIWTRPEPLKPKQANHPQYLTLRGNSQSSTTIATASFVIARATIKFVPDYVRYFPMRMSEADLRSETDQTRARYWQLSANGKRERLQKALKLKLEIIKRTEQHWQESGNQGAQPERWLTVAELYLELKQFADARQALLREDDNRIYGSDTNRIEKLKQRLIQN